MAGFRKDTQTAQQTTQPAPPSSVEVEEEENPIQVTEAVEVDSLHDQESGILPASTKVISSVKKANIKTMLIDNKIALGERLDSTTLDINKWTTKSLHLELKITGKAPEYLDDPNASGGIDGKGSYAGKVLFCDLVLAVNMVALKEAHARRALAAQIKGQKVKPFNETWWARESRYNTKQFYAALGYDVSLPVPPADDSFLIALVGCDIVHDITRVADSFRGDGEFKNEVKNFRSVEG